MHLILDGYCKNIDLLQDESLLRTWMSRTARQIGMTVYGKPEFRNYPWPGSDAPAFSGICFLAESSIVIHAYPEYSFVFIDIFSCKDFDCDLVEGSVCRDFGVTMPRVLQLERGISKGRLIPVAVRR